MPGVKSSFMRPTTAEPRRMAGGGSMSPTRTRNVPVTGSARGETSRTRPLAVTFGSLVSATVISGLRGALSFTTDGTSNTASLPPVRAIWMIMRPAGTTSPGSAPTRVIVPGASAVSRV